jgi:hypothetical protein
LLVVIAVISLLLSLVLPALWKARETSRRVVCGTRLRGLSNSWEVYCVTERMLPPLSHYHSSHTTAPEGIDVNYQRNSAARRFERVRVSGFGPETWDALIQPSGQQWLTLYHRNKIYHWTAPEWNGEWRNFGTLWDSEALRDPQVFFCPSVRNPDLQLGTPYNPWPPKPGYGGHPEYPRWVNHTNAAYERRVALTGVLWDRIGLSTTIATDMMWPEDIAETHRNGLNASYRDGHVSYIKDKRLLDWWNNDEDTWTSADTQLKVLDLSYWLDLQGKR